MNDPDDTLPATLRAVEDDVRREAVAATRARLDALVEGALAATEAAPARRVSPRRAWVFALTATLGVATALAAGVAVWRRPAEPVRPRAVAVPTAPVVMPVAVPRARPVVEELADAGPVVPDDASPAVVRRPRGSAPVVTPVAVAEAPAVLYRRANEARRARAHDEAAALYRALIAGHPDAAESQQARVSLGRLLLDRGRGAGEAEALFAAYLRREPRGIEAETAMAGRARSLQASGARAEERSAWGALLRAFPESAHGEEARRRVAELGGE